MKARWPAGQEPNAPASRTVFIRRRSRSWARIGVKTGTSARTWICCSSGQLARLGRKARMGGL